MNTITLVWEKISFLFIVSLVAAILVYASPVLSAPSVKWKPAAIVKDVGIGESITAIASFTASTNLTKVSVRVVPEIASYVTVTPKFFSSIKKGSTYTLNMTLTAPSDALPASKDGTIHLTSADGNSTYALPLPVSMTLVRRVAHYEPGTTHEELTTTVDAYGGTLTVDNPASPINGVQVIFPAGAIRSAERVALGYNDGRVSPRSGRFSGAILSLDPESTHIFDRPVRIVVPFSEDTTAIPVPYYITPDGRLRSAQLLSIDRLNHTFVFETFHASLFTWIFGVNVAEAPGLNDIIQTGFLPGEDGFQIPNIGSYYNEGECLGMAAFAQWYWRTWTSSGGDFFPKYYDVLGSGLDGKPIRGQDIIATRAFLSINQNSQYFRQSETAQISLTDANTYSVIYNTLLNTGQPQIIGLTHKDNSPGGHAVLAYAADYLTGNIIIYDNNFPGGERVIHYDAGNKLFDAYTGWFGLLYSYDEIFQFADGSLPIDEPFQNILDDANQNFQGSWNAKIDITSHSSGQRVSNRNVTLSGTIQSGEVLINELQLQVGSRTYPPVSVGINGAFSIPVELLNGVNHIFFNTKGNDADEQKIAIANNTTTGDFTLIADVPLSAVLMTLTWDSNDTDLDTYVIDPTGDYSAYYHRVTADGGSLDRDITTGYGPEHWTLKTTDVIRYGSPYRFRAHYYSDYGHGPTNYTVTIQLYEGTAREVTYTYRGNLAISNPSNTTPNGVGPDWADIAAITLTQPTTARSAEIISPDTPTPNSIGDGLVIIVPVPPVDERVK